MKIQYHKFGDYYLSNLTIEGQETEPIGKYGRMRMRYLKEHRLVQDSNMLLANCSSTWLRSTVPARIAWS